MGYNEQAIRKGVTAEFLAKVYFTIDGWVILIPDSHETSYDFVIEKNGEFRRVQVKTASVYGDLIRVRNKHGQNRTYDQNAYDILVGVWVERKRLYLFHSEDVNSGQHSESISVGRVDGKTMHNRPRPKPYTIINM